MATCNKKTMCFTCCIYRSAITTCWEKKIQHKVREEGHDEIFWCKGNVLDVCSINENNIKKLYILFSMMVKKKGGNFLCLSI